MSAPDTIHISLNLNFVLNFYLVSAHCIFLAYVTDVRQMLVARERVLSLYEVTRVTSLFCRYYSANDTTDVLKPTA